MKLFPRREYTEIHPLITPQMMRPESTLGALLSGKPRYVGPTADQLNEATRLCFEYRMSADMALAMVGSPQAASTAARDGGDVIRAYHAAERERRQEIPA